jgi:cell division transport system ATP-binding protein
LKLIAKVKKETRKLSIKGKKPRFLVEFQEVTKAYNGIKALKNVSFGLRAGEFVSLVGPSGAGKSTIAKLLLREEIPSHGKIIVAGRDIASFNRRTLPLYRRKVGIIFQDYKLLPHKTVFENIAFALEVCDATPDEIIERVPKILNLVGLADRAKSYPQELSGGEKQRVTIARALIHSPKILMADEPTGNLDPQNTKEVIDLLLRINRTGALVILATHDQQIVNALRRRVIKIDRGKILGDESKSQYL